MRILFHLVGIFFHRSLDFFFLNLFIDDVTIHSYILSLVVKIPVMVMVMIEQVSRAEAEPFVALSYFFETGLLGWKSNLNAT